MAQRFCPNCGHIENEYTYFCTECGAKTELSQGSVAIKPATSRLADSTSKLEPIVTVAHVEEQRKKNIDKQEEVENIDSIRETATPRIAENNIETKYEGSAHYSSDSRN